MEGKAFVFYMLFLHHAIVPGPHDYSSRGEFFILAKEPNVWRDRNCNTKHRKQAVISVHLNDMARNRHD